MESPFRGQTEVDPFCTPWCLHKAIMFGVGYAFVNAAGLPLYAYYPVWWEAYERTIPVLYTLFLIEHHYHKAVTRCQMLHVVSFGAIAIIPCLVIRAALWNFFSDAIKSFSLGWDIVFYSLVSFVVIAFLEETSKFCLLYFYSTKERFRFDPRSLFVYSLCIGCGFSFGNGIWATIVWVPAYKNHWTHGVLNLPMHLATSGYMGVCFIETRFLHIPRWMVHALGVPLFVHGLYNFILYVFYKEIKNAIYATSSSIFANILIDFIMMILVRKRMKIIHSLPILDIHEHILMGTVKQTCGSLQGCFPLYCLISPYFVYGKSLQSQPSMITDYESSLLPGVIHSSPGRLGDSLSDTWGKPPNTADLQNGMITYSPSMHDKFANLYRQESLSDSWTKPASFKIVKS